MRVQDHIGLISWSLVDKALYILYGFVLILIMNYTSLAEFGLFSLLIGLHTWIFTISDSFSLQALIQFGMNEQNREKVNLVSLITHIILTLGVSLIIYLLANPLAGLFNEPRIADIGNFLPILSLAFIPRTFCQKIIYRIQNMFFLFLTNLVFFGVITAFVVSTAFSAGKLTFADLSLFYLYGSLASSVIAVMLTFNRIRFNRAGDIGIRKIYQFSWKMTLINLFHSFPRNIDIFIINGYFNLQTVGLYSAAKNLFRIFEEALNAMNGLVYPSAVKNIAKNNNKGVFELMTKAVSFVFLGFTFLVIILEFGLSELLVKSLLNERYLASIDYFNLLIIAAPFLSLWYIFSIMMAKDLMNEIIFISALSFSIFLLIIVLIGESVSINLIPLGFGSYIIFSGILGFIYGNKYLNFKVSYLFRSLNDIFFFFKKK